MAIKDYGPVIHEFDPWFNYRAAQYLADNGWQAFFTWFEASLHVDSCKRPAYIDNTNGKLVCKGLKNREGIPSGGYQKSCQGCQVDAERSELTCTHCNAADGRQIPGVYDLRRCRPPAQIDNQNGILTC